MSLRELARGGAAIPAAAVLMAGCANVAGVSSANAVNQPDRYELSPIMDDGALQAVEVALTFRGDADGETVVTLPSSFADQQDLWRHVTEIRSTGGWITSGEGAVQTIAHCGGCVVTIRYRVDSAYDQTPAEYAKGGATIWPDRLGCYGEALSATVEGHELNSATFAWRGWPSDWVRVSDLDAATPAAPVTVADIAESTLLAGPGVQRIERAIPGGTLIVGMLGEYEFADRDYVDQLQRIIAAQRGFWGDVTGSFTVNLYPIRDVPGRSSMSGTGRSDAFVIESTSNIDVETIARLIAHEHNHTWIPRRIGELTSDPEALDYWLSEGVTDFYNGRVLVAADIWMPRQFADELNTMLMRHDASPVRNIPNAGIGEGFWSDNELQQLPYDRGWMFALLLDHRIRQASGGRQDYDDLLAIMRDSWKAAPAGGKPELLSAFLLAAGQMGLAIQPLIARHIECGEDIALPADLFAPCGTVAIVERPEFDPGFDRADSNGAGVFVGVDPQSAAYAAGLREGMKRLGYVSSAEGNSQVSMVYRVGDASGERELSWLPAGKRMISVRQFTLGPDAGSAACKKALSGS